MIHNVFIYHIRKILCEFPHKLQLYIVSSYSICYCNCCIICQLCPPNCSHNVHLYNQTLKLQRSIVVTRLCMAYSQLQMSAEIVLIMYLYKLAILYDDKICLINKSKALQLMCIYIPTTPVHVFISCKHDHPTQIQFEIKSVSIMRFMTEQLAANDCVYAQLYNLMPNIGQHTCMYILFSCIDIIVNPTVW